ncbi:TnsA endonuclease N-terminal domain-containing protein [Flavobacterium sharifuzzamanii]|uniref:TnsA endonuclease N-terminal domain-containing protein n=1 Tax=Flavobacterium sharifuzzamanii TaxID=2211133 RepID=UPI000DACDF2F|nr:TnsA endonuclease N-terminal domain-containing protein [Flavobacterium sharifuzzamanii]KAF2082001.1 hypothetical protein DMA14_05900 [Flavobacterium sharifuzzamanii]
MLRIFKKRAREIGYKYSSLSGYFVSKKQQNEIIQFESALERDYIYLLEFNPSVLSYLEQPLSIFYTDSRNKKHKYTPDFLVIYSDNNIQDTLVEIKYHEDLTSNSLIYKEKFQAADKFCKKNNLTFVILSEREIRDSNQEYLNNIKFLSAYRDAFEVFEKNGHEVDDKGVFSLLNRINVLKNCSIIYLIDSLTDNEYYRAELIYCIWYLIANRYVKCDLNKKLNLSTMIWVS